MTEMNCPKCLRVMGLTSTVVKQDLSYIKVIRVEQREYYYCEHCNLVVKICNSDSWVENNLNIKGSL